MKLSALDIRKQEFSRALRGYDQDEVDSFLDVLSDQWKEQVDELKRANDRINELELKLEHYQKVEEALEEALQTARSSARQTLEQAENKARAMVEEAEARAEDITRDAEEDRREIKRETARFTVRRKEIVAKLRAFLISEMEMLAHYDEEDPTGFIKLLSSGEDAGEIVHPPETEDESETEDEIVDEVDEEEGPGDGEEEALSEEPTWKVNRMVDESREDDDEHASSEIKKIRRILEDLDR